MPQVAKQPRQEVQSPSILKLKSFVRNVRQWLDLTKQAKPRKTTYTNKNDQNATMPP